MAVLIEYLQIHINPIVEYGEVWDIQPKPDNVSSFVVLVGTMDEHGARSARWFDYSRIRRLDNNGPLHTVSTYTGRPPWIGLPVKAIHGPFKDRGVGTIQDVTADPESHSGLSILVEFTLGYVVGKRARLHIDYDLVRRADTGRFIHDTKWPDSPKNSYFQFKMGYFPEYSVQEMEAFHRSVLAPTPAVDSPVHMHSSQPLSPFFRFSDIGWKNDFADYWLLDR